jgi:hypothetical protein
MRNSGEDMKRFNEEQGDLVTNAGMEPSNEIKAIQDSGDNPTRMGSQTSALPGQTNVSSERKNVFLRGLQGFGSRNPSEILQIEKMPEQLPEEVESLRPTSTYLGEKSGERDHNKKARSDGFERSHWWEGPLPPPKIRDDGLFVPPDQLKVALSPASDRPASYINNFGAARAAGWPYEEVNLPHFAKMLTDEVSVFNRKDPPITSWWEQTVSSTTRYGVPIS